MVAVAEKLPFYGREKEIAVLQQLREVVQEKGIGRFAVVTGRRRIGKTRLIDVALPAAPDMPKIYGFINDQAGERQNLEDFTQAIKDALGIPYPIAFRNFEEALSMVFQEAQSRPITLVLDEFQNFQTFYPGIFGVLQKLWDRHHTRSKVLLVVAGSVASSMREIFENNAAPLFARNDAFIRLQPFLPGMVKRIFADYSPGFSGEDLLALYCLSGGVAQYLQQFLLMQAYTLKDMLRLGVNLNSNLLSEAQLMIAAEFRSSAVSNNELLQMIALGHNKRSELLSAFEVDVSGHLYKLENYFGLIERVEPVGKNGAVRQRVRYEIADELLDFWYSFILPNLRMLQSEKTSAIRELILAQYPTWSGRVLERLYRRHFRNLGLFTEVGPWWDRRGENELDLVAVNAQQKTIVFGEVKRNSAKINLAFLEPKIAAFMDCNPQYASFERSVLRLSLDELGADGKLPFEDQAAAD